MVRRAIEADDAEPVLSAASVWEMAIKAGLGRLVLPAPIEVIVTETLAHGIRVLPVEWQHAAAVERLPKLHGDPFERLLIAQAVSDGLTVASADPVFRRYGVNVLW